MADRVTRTDAEIMAAPESGARETAIEIEIMVAKPAAFTGGQNPDIPFTF